ncbi:MULTISPECIES: ATP-binding protein [unclassified Mucilaginibacter]|uniref:ATP-binding protein n=1 Tax=unclassified Mucilaginibacter TaxID=2617802 RepID=UPI002AC92328|nr:MULTISPECIES: ATP-binding protein [unclassified Mucilaginibacter]MEB0264058.1 ATP-binding protein [Mucilaginibacter sp. 10I4]MEB0277779.1 ATP-binding protein [Mucilaginibacter sp. 10B2]MEB0301899.1 ATP-binding protein [Mucilaginibacter sp. 5C4]WPX24597.1 ATP-binding protein [Mucilaginibacter sp. 5C4]
MIAGVKKISILRYALIVMLIVVLFGSAFYLYLHYNKAEKLRGNFQQMVNARENSSLIDSCIVELYSADNSSRMYALTGRKWYSNEFARQIKNVRGIITAINSNDKKSANLSGDDELGNLVSEKKLKTDSYIKLMALSDSLMRSAKKINEALKDKDNKIIQQPVVRRIKTQVRIDTVKTVAIAKTPEQKKKLFGRLFSVFDKKKKEEGNKLVLLTRRTDTIITTMTASPKVAQAYNKYYTKIYDANNKLRANEREMLEINNRLISQIIGSLKKYKVAEQQYIVGSREEMNSNLSTVLYEFKRLSGIMFLLLTTVVVIILYNIWKIFRNEEELVVYTEMAEKHVQSKSRFLASMSHEIRTPLNSIIGFSEQLTQSNLTATQTEQSNAIRSSSKMLLEVVNEILDFSKYETGKMNFETSPFSPFKAIQEIATSMQVQAGKKNIALKHDINFVKDFCFNGDCFRLKQVIMNLVGNAIKFTTIGEVAITAFLTEGKPGQQILNVQVRDTGLGIDKEHLPLLFEEFSQVASAQKTANYSGTGLGLAICKKIIELQGGSIKVTSKVGKGSVFNFKLPMDVAEKGACVKQQEVVAQFDPKQFVAGRHVLIAEDNKLNVLLVSTILKKWKISFDIAYNGREALQLFEDKHYDIVLTDIEMPEMGGIELTQVIRTNGNTKKGEVPILALTANVLKEDRDKYLSVGMSGVVLKPFSEQNLIDNVAAALQKKSELVG